MTFRITIIIEELFGTTSFNEILSMAKTTEEVENLEDVLEEYKTMLQEFIKKNGK